MKLHEIEDHEQYQLDKANLISLQEHMDNRLSDKLDKIHMSFLDEYLRSKRDDKIGKVTDEECYLIRKVFEFIKKNI